MVATILVSTVGASDKSSRQLLDRILEVIFPTESGIRPTRPVPHWRPPDLTFADLENNFHKRTFGFQFYKERLGKKNPRLLNWIGSIDYSGHIREQSLRYLIDNYLPGDENRIMLRLEDWVPQIQELALQWTKMNFCGLTMEEIDANHRLILYLSRKQKLAKSEAMQVINECLLLKIDQLTREQFLVLDTKLRRYLYRLGLSISPKLRSWMLGDSDPFNRLQFMSYYSLDELTGVETEALRQDKSSWVQRRFLIYQLDNGVVPTKEELTGFALGRNKGLREIARFYLSRDYGIDADELYRQQTDDRFYYIADLAKASDLARFMEGARLGSPQVKHLCVQAINKIDVMQLKALDLKQLLLENRRLRLLILRRLPILISVEELKTFKSTIEQATVNGDLVYLNLLYHKSFWHFLDSSLSWLMKDVSEEKIVYILQRIRSKTSLHEPLPSSVRKSIEKKADALRVQRGDKPATLLREVEFVVGNA